MIIRYIPILALFFFSSLIAQTPFSDQELDQQIQALLKPVLEKNLFSGTIWIARGEEVLFQKSYGFTDVKEKKLNTLETRFGIGSITKAMTGIIVDQLIEEKKLDLNLPVEHYIAGFPSGPKGKKPTINDLVNHRSGIPHRVTDQKEETQYWSPKDIVEKVKVEKLVFSPGKKRLYSSTGYTVLARIVEIIERQPFQKVLAIRIFEPANMKFVSDSLESVPNSNYATPYFLGMQNHETTAIPASYKNLSFLTGAGSIYATAQDLHHFLNASRKGALGKGFMYKRINAKANTWRAWSGRTSGYEAYMDFLPGQNLSIILLSNLRSSATWQIRAQLRNILLHGKFEKVVLPPPLAETQILPESLVGIYDNNGSQVEIRLQKGKLFRGDNEFYPIANEQYYILASGTKMKFKFNKNKQAEALIQIRGDREILMPRIQ